MQSHGNLPPAVNFEGSLYLHDNDMENLPRELPNLQT